MSQRLGKYLASFDYFDKSLIVLSAASGSISIAFFATVIGASVEIASASFSLAFSLSTGFIKKLLKTTKIKRKSIKFFCYLEVNCSIKRKSSEALTNYEISSGDFRAIINEGENYRELKDEKSKN